MVIEQYGDAVLVPLLGPAAWDACPIGGGRLVRLITALDQQGELPVDTGQADSKALRSSAGAGATPLGSSMNWTFRPRFLRSPTEVTCGVRQLI
ncbi:hypothetical protein [Streptomyces sp. NBC_01530]|uniref:hypothetical protein n=1 Tax=Streptomyces sp. NBC_01530 TaxID=2903895 RepID=UPI0038702BDD